MFSEKVETKDNIVSDARWRFWAWTALILVVVLPWANFQNHTHWQRVAWIPFVSPPVKVRDVIVNVLLYVPWGYLYIRHMPEGLKRPWLALVFAASLSVASEGAQLFSHGRFPSATDAACNVLGAFAGARYARRRTR
jgi:glycopeptide antibiotics resistance protein